MTTPTPADYEGAHSTGSTTAPAEATRADAPPTGKADDTVVAASPAAAAAGSPEETYQIAYLLLQLQEAPGGRLAKGKANRFPRAVQRELNLSADAANALRERLVEEGYVRSGRKAGSLTYELTDEGRAHLQTLQQKPLPAGRSTVPEGPVSDQVRQHRRTFLLFQLFEADGQVLDQKAVNRFREPGRKFLNLKAPVANDLRKLMAAEGLIRIERQGKNATYRLTAAGREELGGKAHFPTDVEMTVSGRILNELLEAARDSAKQFEHPAEPTTHPADLPRVPSEEGVTEEQPVFG